MTDDRMTMDARSTAVEAMARADWERLRQVYNDPKYGYRETMVSWEDADEGEREAYRDRAALMLDALLSSGLAVLMGSLEQVGWLHDEDDIPRSWRHITERAPRSFATPTWKRVFAVRSREEEGT